MAKKSSGKSKSIKLDLRGVEKGRRAQRFPEGEYKVKIIKAEKDTNQNSGNTSLKLTFEVVEPAKFAGKPLTDYLALTKKAMFRVGWVLDACGIKWSEKLLTLDLEKFKGKVIGIALYDDEYNGKVRSKVADYYSEDEVDEYLKASDDDDDEDEDEDLEDDEDDDDEDEDDDDDDDDDDEDDDL